MGDQIGIAKPVIAIDCKLKLSDISPSVLSSLPCHVIKNFAQDFLGIDPNSLIPEMQAAYPMRMPGDDIVPAVPYVTPYLRRSSPGVGGS